MKKFLVFTAFTLVSLVKMNGQITILSSDVSAIGLTAERVTDTIIDASIDPGGTGQLSWDFSSLVEDSVLAYAFQPAAGTPYQSDFPSATFVGIQGNNYFYFLQNDDVLAGVGTYGTFTVSGITATTFIHVDPPQSVLRFPVNYNDSFTEQVVRTAQVKGTDVGVSFADSVRYVSTVDREVMIDAYGEMITPADTFQTVRTRETEVAENKIYTLAFGAWTLLPTGGGTVTTVTHNWWTNEGNVGFPVMQLEPKLGGGYKANWLKKSIVGSNGEKFDLSFSLYPNPAPDEAIVAFPELFIGSLEVVNMQGQVVFRQGIQDQQVRFSTENLSIGTYLLGVRNEQGVLAGAKMFQVQR